MPAVQMTQVTMDRGGDITWDVGLEQIWQKSQETQKKTLAMKELYQRRQAETKQSFFELSKALNTNFITKTYKNLWENQHFEAKLLKKHACGRMCKQRIVRTLIFHFSVQELITRNVKSVQIRGANDLLFAHQSRKFFRGNNSSDF